jgi:hypothetical protein
MKADTQSLEAAQSTKSRPQINSFVDLTVVSGYAECFVALTAVAVLLIAMRLSGDI